MRAFSSWHSAPWNPSGSSSPESQTEAYSKKAAESAPPTRHDTHLHFFFTLQEHLSHLLWKTGKFPATYKSVSPWDRFTELLSAWVWKYWQTAVVPPAPHGTTQVLSCQILSWKSLARTEWVKCPEVPIHWLMCQYWVQLQSEKTVCQVFTCIFLPYSAHLSH